MNWFKKAEFKNTEGIVYDIYSSIGGAVGGAWTVKSSKEMYKIYKYQKYIIAGFDGHDVIMKGDYFFVKVQIFVKRASNIMHPYEGASEWGGGKESLRYNYTEEDWQAEEQRRWDALNKLTPEDASKYDDAYGSRLISFNVVIDGMKPTGKPQPKEYDSILTHFGLGDDVLRLGSSEECDTPSEIADYVKTAIHKFYFGDGGGGNDIKDIPSPSSSNSLKPDMAGGF